MARAPPGGGDWIALNRVNVIAGAPGSGKSTLMHCLTAKYAHAFCWGMVICPQAGENYPWFDPHFRYDLDDPDDIERVVAGLLRIQSSDKTQILPGILIMDDCLGAVNWRRKTFKKLFIRTRHTKITLLLATQQIVELPTFVRNCAGAAFVYYQESEDAQLAVYRSFATSACKKKDVGEWFLRMTHKYNKTTKKWYPVPHRCIMYRPTQLTPETRHLPVDPPYMDPNSYYFISPLCSRCRQYRPVSTGNEGPSRR